MHTDSTDWLPFLLQTGDPLFPTGAYAHSLGLEEIVRLGLVKDETTLLDFLKNQIIPGLAHLELPYLRYAYEAAQRSDMESLCALDLEISAWKIPHELREASTQLGVRRLRMLMVLFPGELLSQFEAKISAQHANGHHLVIYVLQMTAQNVPLRAALLAYLYQSLAGFSSAALKLIRIGQEGCQRVLKSALENAGTCVETSLAIKREEAGWFNPLLEIAAMRHERANERLFIS